jgi:hypothetical protein
MRRTVVGLCALFAFVPPALHAQDAGPLAAEIEVGEFVARDAGVTVRLSRPPLSGTERLAVFIDRTDVTGLFRPGPRGRELRYDRGVVQLPEGEHELVVYRVNPATGAWDELARQGFTTLGRFGFRPGQTDPSLTAAWSPRLADGFDPQAAAPPETGENVDLQFRLSTEHVRENLSISTDVAVVGATRQEEALRFRDEGEDAPRIDLSSYRIDAGGAALSPPVGHVTGGGQRHLVNNFAARGATLSARPASRLDVTVSAQNGSNEVGWSNLAGLNDGDHRLISGSLGLEALPTPGALRIEVTGMRGAVEPRAGFNQGVVNDSERSHGFGVRLTAAGFDRRLRLDAGYATSTFDNPDDPLLGQGFAVVEVDEDEAGARYLEASFDALRDLPLGGGRTARLTLGVRHERVDPLYRSLGAFAQADRQNNAIDVRAELAGVSLQANYGETRNNLADIASILTQFTERSRLDVGLPLAQVLDRRTPWLPSLRLRFDRTDQFGEGLPENGGFSPSHVPNQVSLDRTASVDWRFSKVSLGVNWNRSEQDNQQEGREDADLNVTRRGLSLQLTPLRRVRLSVDLVNERSENLERDETDETLRWGGQLSWQLLERSSLSVRVSDTATEDDLATRRRTNRQFNAQWSSGIPLLDLLEGQYFVRYNRNESTAVDAVFDQDDAREAWWLDLGLNFTFF